MRPSRREVAITGIGLVSPAGNAIEPFFERVWSSRSCIGPIMNVESERLNCQHLAQVHGFDAVAEFGARHAGTMDRVAQFAVHAARSAIRDADLDLAHENRAEIAVVLGSASAGIDTLDGAYRKFYEQRAQRLHPLTVPMGMFSAAASHVSIDLNLGGEVCAISSACASSAHALGRSLRMISSGECDVVVSGGSEACLTVGMIKGWEALRVLADDTCRPFCATRRGLVLGEGAAVLILEELGRAERRGARIYARLAGYGATADANSMTSPTLDGPARAIRRALDDSDLAGSDIDYINAHGTGTLLNDLTEVGAIRAVFGQHAEQICLSSSKGVLGHSLGAAGALEAAITALSLYRGAVTPTANWRSDDPECGLDVVPNVGRMQSIRAALSNSFAFGGLNAVLAFTKH